MNNSTLLQADVIIVGSGPGGATTARQLARAGKKVLLLERGIDYRSKKYYGTYLGALIYGDRMSLLFTQEGLNIVRPLMVGGATSMYCGWEIWFPPGIYAVGTTILLDAEAICLKGSNAGGYVFGNNTGLTEGAVLKWIGAGDGTLMQVGSTTTRRGIQVKDMQLDGDNLAGTCQHVVNASNSYFEQLVIKDAKSRCLDITSNDTDPGGLNSVYNCAFRDIMIVGMADADGIYAGTTTGAGDLPAFCTCDNIHITHSGTGNGINLHEMDDCVFINCATTRARQERMKR